MVWPKYTHYYTTIKGEALRLAGTGLRIEIVCEKQLYLATSLLSSTGFPHYSPEFRSLKVSNLCFRPKLGYK